MKDNQLVIENFLNYKKKNNSSNREDGISPMTIHVYRMDLSALDKKIKKPFKQMKQEDIEYFLDEYKQGTKNHYIPLFRAFFRWLYTLEEDDTLPDVIRRIKPRAIKKDEIAFSERVITPEEYNAIIEGCNKPMHRALIESLWISGARKEEIQNIQVGDVSYDGHYTTIKLRVSKTNTREVIHPGRAEHLLKWRETLSPFHDKPDELLFQTYLEGKYKPIDTSYTWEVLDAVCKRLHMRHVKVHDFRHTRATMLLREGIPDTHVKTLLGWTKNSSMLRVYDHNKIKDVKEWMDRKNRNIKPTYELLEKQKNELETKHERELQALKKQVTGIEQEMRKLLRESDKKLSRRDPELHKSIQELKG